MEFHKIDTLTAIFLAFFSSKVSCLFRMETAETLEASVLDI
jgi:hypothetical protein